MRLILEPPLLLVGPEFGGGMKLGPRKPERLMRGDWSAVTVKGEQSVARHGHNNVVDHNGFAAWV